MKRFLTSLCWFLVLAALSYVFWLSVWGDYAPAPFKQNLKYKLGAAGFTFTRLQEADDYGDVDILFLGSSHAYRGFDVRIFRRHGLKTFNLGSSSQTPLQTEILLQRYADKFQPRLVVFEVSPVVFTLDGVESSLDILSNDKNDIFSVKLAIEQNHIKVYNTLLYAFYRDWTQANEGFSEPLQKGKDTYISGGFVERRLATFTPEPFEKTEWVFQERQFAAFERSLRFLSRRGVPVILVRAPTTQVWREAHVNDEDFNVRMANYGTFWNFNELLQLDDTIHFYDPHHLNQVGVEIFNEKLVQMLIDHGFSSMER